MKGERMDDVLTLLDWRRAVASLYAQVRALEPVDAHARWRAGRDDLFRQHPQSPLPVDDPLRETGLPYWPYDPSLRFTAALTPSHHSDTRTVDDASGGAVRLRSVGEIVLGPLGITVLAWWFDQYGGGLFVPLRDATAGTDSYGGGRYLLDTAKGADLGDNGQHELIIDLNFLYHPSCRYSDAWTCPLAAPENTTQVRVEAGERMPNAS
jgi:uncharacterized protein